MATLERATSARAKCAWCGRAIEVGAVRLKGKKSAHLDCGIERERDQVAIALLNRDTSGTLVSEILAEVARLDPTLADEVRAGRKFKSTRASRELDDPQTEKLLRELEADPGNRGLLTVLGDHLQQLGDERGELISLDLAASTEQAAMTRRREICVRLAPPFDKSTWPKPTWGIGFLRKLELMYPGKTLATHAEGFGHPSCRLLESVQFGTHHRLGITIPAGVLPRSLRTLTVHDSIATKSDLTSLPYLTQLSCMDADRLVHPTLSALTLENPSNETLDALQHDDLPAVRTLTLEQHIYPFLDRLAHFLPQLTELALDRCVFDDDSYELLEKGLAGHKLAHLTIAPWHDTPLDRERLALLTDGLVITATKTSAPAAGSFVIHEKFGRGEVIRAFDGKLEIAFKSGKRTLKDGPYLQRSRG